MRLTRAVLLLALIRCFPGSPIAAQTFPAVQNIGSDKYIVRLIRFERYGHEYAYAKFTFEVENKVTGGKASLELANWTTGLSGFELSGDLLLVFGQIGVGAGGVTIADLAVPQVKDFILCYSPAVSETKRYLIFTHFYPPHGPPESQSDVLEVYDLRASPLENRLTSESKTLKAKNPAFDNLEFLVAAEQVGHPIYPEEDVGMKPYTGWAESPSERHDLGPPGTYAWFEDDKKLIFIDYHAGDTWLVLVDLSEGLDKPVIRKKAIDVTAILAADRRSPDYDEILKREREGLAVTRLRYFPDSNVDIEFSREKYEQKVYKALHLEMKLP